ncbi:MAG: carbohydrate binding family 9 domain-containing protein [Gammaproteobacteria bacterium]|nr:carbohydrate binding family 9 domain-containing protein [Gammaproteobacteria bacterium]
MNPACAPADAPVCALGPSPARPLRPARAAALALPLALALGLALGLATARPARAAPDGIRPRPQAMAVRIEPAAVPHIDGDLADAAWNRAAPIGDFTQTNPQPLEPASERTEVRFLYDDTHLYVGIYCHDSEPAGIVSTVRERDGMMPRDDFVRLMLDPQLSRRNGYAFEVNPEGARTDALVQNNSEFLVTWNMIWEARTRRVADGWTVELALPFRGLSYPGSGGDWGLDVVRQIRRKTEMVRWAPTPAGMRDIDISLAGTLQGLTGLPGGGKLDLQTYGALRYGRDWGATDAQRLLLQPSATLYYKLTSALTATLTANTDFSDAPLDERRVNTGRFALFDPETREFFLQDASQFAFGGLNLDKDQNGSPFFSRRIGIVGSQATRLLGGAKLSGTAGAVALGALSVRTHALGGVDPQQLTVARASIPVLGESTAGMILTHGDPLGGGRNSVAGADFRFRDSDIGEGRRLLIDGFAERSMSDTHAGTGSAWGLAVSLPNEPWSLFASYKQIGADFRPALGFVNRPGIRDAFTEIERTWRPRRGVLQVIKAGINHNAITGTDGRLQTRNTTPYLILHNTAGDELQLSAVSEHEFLSQPFVLPGGILVPPGGHTWWHAKALISTSPGRRLYVRWNIDCCRFFDGRLLGNDVEFSWRPVTLIDLSMRYGITDLRLPSGRAQIRIGQLTLNLNFTPDMQLRSQLQYDSVSGTLGALLRYRWEYTPGSEIFAAVGEAAHVTGALPSLGYHSSGSELLLRLGHRFQF